MNTLSTNYVAFKNVYDKYASEGVISQSSNDSIHRLCNLYENIDKPNSIPMKGVNDFKHLFTIFESIYNPLIEQKEVIGNTFISMCMNISVCVIKKLFEMTFILDDMIAGYYSRNLIQFIVEKKFFTNEFAFKYIDYIFESNKDKIRC